MVPWWHGFISDFHYLNKARPEVKYISAAHICHMCSQCHLWYQYPAICYTRLPYVPCFKKKFKTIFFYLESFSLSQGLAWRANKHLRFPCSGCQISNSPAQMSSLRLRHFCFILYRVSHFRQLSRIFSREGDLQIQLEFIKICSLRVFFEKVPFVQVDISNSIMLSKSVQ